MGVEAGSISLLEPVLDALPSPKLLIEPGTGRVLYANPAAHRLAGGSMPLAGAAEDYDATYGVYDESGRRLPNDEHPGVRAARGERLRNVAVDWVTAAGRRSIVVSGDIVTLPGTEPVTVLTIEDVTELQAARRRSALLAEAGRRLASSLDPAEVAATIADLVVPAYADRCAIDVAPDHADTAVVTAGRTEVPLRAHGRVLGTLALESDIPAPARPELDLEALQELADRCAIALDNARLYSELSAAEADARRASEEVNTILGGVADAVTAQAPDGTLVYANDAAVELLGFDNVGDLLAAPISEVASRYEMLDEHLQPLAVDQLPGRRALAGLPSEPLIVRSRRTDVARAAVDARQGHPGVRRQRRRPAGDQRDRGHHRAQARRAGPALPRRGGARARGVAGVRGDARHRGTARGARHRRLVRGRRAGGRWRAGARGGHPRRSREGRGGHRDRRPLPAGPELEDRPPRRDADGALRGLHRGDGRDAGGVRPRRAAPRDAALDRHVLGDARADGAARHGGRARSRS